MGRLLLAIVVVLSLAAMTVGATLGGFSDTEVSRGNIFEVADLDLRVARANDCWQAIEFYDDQPWGGGLEPVFSIGGAEMCQQYRSYLLLWNVGSVPGIAHLKLRVTEDTASIADTTSVRIWYDTNGNLRIDDGETTIGDLASFDGNAVALGPLPACEIRRLRLLVTPDAGAGEAIAAFDLAFDTEFRLVQGDSIGFSDTETAASYLTGSGYEGCTARYWRENLIKWELTGYYPDFDDSKGDTVGEIFSGASRFPDFAEASLQDALEFPGGDAARGAAQILLREAVAALLNAAHPHVNYPRLEEDIIADVDTALASPDFVDMLNLAQALDEDNNLGCPWNDD